jgi:5-methylcytosine-specific restriction endonuclease McrA
MGMSKRTKALAIPKEVKARVWERDGGCCVYCGSPLAAPVAHYIARSHGGLGIEENILSLCQNCHRKYDQSTKRNEMRVFFRDYLQSKYPEWDETKLIYRR